MLSQRNNTYRSKKDLLIEKKIERLFTMLMNESDDDKDKKVLDWETKHNFNPKYQNPNTYKVFFNSLPAKYVKDIMSHFVGNKKIFTKDANTIQIYIQNPNWYKDAGMQVVEEVTDIFKSDGYYNVPTLDDIKAACERSMAATKAGSKKKQAEMQKKVDDMFIYWYQHYNDPDVQLLIKSFAPYGFDERKHGHIFSVRNVAILRGQNPNVTFVATERDWRTRYNRRVNPGAQPLVYFTPLPPSGHTSDELNNATRKVHGGNTKFSDLTHQQKTHIQYDELYDNYDNFMKVIGYDVADTTVIDGLRDKWLDIGFKNSMTGEPNEALEDLAAQQSTGEENKDLGTKLYGKEGDVVKMYKALEVGIRANEFKARATLRGDDEKDYRAVFVTLVKELGRELIEDMAKIVKKENQDLVLKIVVTITLILCRLNPEEVARSLRNDDLTREDYMKVRNIINKIIYTIKLGMSLTAETSKNESYMRRNINEFKLKGLDSVEELLDMMGMDMNDVPSKEDQIYERRRNDILKKKKLSENKRSFYDLYKKLW